MPPTAFNCGLATAIVICSQQDENRSEGQRRRCTHPMAPAAHPPRGPSSWDPLPPHGRRFEIKRPRALAHCCNRADRRAASTGKCGCIQRPPCGIKVVSRTPTLAGDAGSTQPIVQLASPRGPVASPVHRRPTRGVKRRSPCTGLASKPPSSAPRRRHRAAPPTLARRGAPAGTRRVTPIHRRRASAARLGRVGAWAKGLAAHVRAGPERDSLAPAVWRGGCAAGARCRLPLAAGV